MTSARMMETIHPRLGRWEDHFQEVARPETPSKLEPLSQTEAHPTLTSNEPVLHRLKLFCKADRRQDGVLVWRISRYLLVSQFSIKSFSFRLLTPGLQDNAAGAGT